MYKKVIVMDKCNKDTRKTYFEYYRVKRSVEFIDQCDVRKSWQGLQDKIRRRKAHRRVIFSASVAATVTIFLVTMTYLHIHLFLKTDIISEVAFNSFPEMGCKRAFLTLSGGMQVDLSRQSGRVDGVNSEIEINNANQQLVYKAAVAAVVVPRYNTLSVPRGGEYKLVLSDGTKVWLNAESSLRYQEIFGDKREVFLTGEAYFEVAKDSTRPFFVRVGDSSVEVLGTHFNVSAYPGGDVCTTLVEGKVKVGNPSGSVVLVPDEQAVVVDGEKNITIRKVDASRYISWIKGSYAFKDMELEDIVAQLSRWYDVDIRFAEESLKGKRFAGVIYRDEELGFAIEVIERVAGVRFIRDGNLIYINSSK